MPIASTWSSSVALDRPSLQRAVMTSSPLPPRAPEAWIGGIVATPTYVVDAGETYRPELLLWIGPDDTVLGRLTTRPDGALNAAAAHLRATILAPADGMPRRPARIRVATEALAEALRADLDPGITVECAPTPEFARRVLDMYSLAASLDLTPDLEEQQQTFVMPTLPADDVAAFFTAMARLYRVDPWSAIPGDRSLVAVRSNALAFDEVLVFARRNPGDAAVACFASRAQVGAYRDAAAAFQRGATSRPFAPAHTSLNFADGASLDASIRADIAARGYQLAGDNAYPWAAQVDDDLVRLPPTKELLTKLTVIAHAVADLVENNPHLAMIFAGMVPVVIDRPLDVDTPAGVVDTTLLAPAPGDANAPVVYDDFLDKNGEPDPAKVATYCQWIIRRVAAAPEGCELGKLPAARALLDYAARYQGLAADSFTPDTLTELLFEILPSELPDQAFTAAQIVQELRVLLTVLHREFKLAGAAVCNRALGLDTVPRLGRALADRRKWGEAKTLFVDGAAAGFATHTKAGLAAWLDEVARRPGLREPTVDVAASPTNRSTQVAPAASVRAQRAKKSSAQRAARKKQRR